MPPELKLFFEQLINGITVGSLYAMIALGYTMVYGVLSMVNFAHGDIYMVGAYWGYFTLSLLGKHGWLQAEPVGQHHPGLLVRRSGFRADRHHA